MGDGDVGRTGPAHRLRKGNTVRMKNSPVCSSGTGRGTIALGIGDADSVPHRVGEGTPPLSFSPQPVNNQLVT